RRNFPIEGLQDCRIAGLQRDRLRPMLRRTTTFVASLVCGSLVAMPCPAYAQDPMAAMRQELDALRAEVQQLRAAVEALQGLQGPAPAQPASVEILQAQVAELAQTKVESTTKLPLKIFGTVHAGFFANSANPNWLDNPNLVGAPPATGGNGTMSASLRQTRV